MRLQSWMNVADQIVSFGFGSIDLRNKAETKPNKAIRHSPSSLYRHNKSLFFLMMMIYFAVLKFIK
ncbi:hypothetical protein VII00023_13342 [Vibrio ichthyoenteri ATCC 700023]|uniref:Uncharacterized protein n=1 Tax=Vibrio ichthyoenteri ATCC 700023 TaxID=870968 RepID=F9S3Q8_9VIBR|nr:hypothetical protein VII00023_13342 [Vibrio ichthyoenteri ATCC 700023]